MKNLDNGQMDYEKMVENIMGEAFDILDDLCDDGSKEAFRDFIDRKCEEYSNKLDLSKEKVLESLEKFRKFYVLDALVYYQEDTLPSSLEVILFMKYKLKKEGEE